MATKQQVRNALKKQGATWDEAYDTFDAPAGYHWVESQSHGMPAAYDPELSTPANYDGFVEGINSGVYRCDDVICDNEDCPNSEPVEPPNETVVMSPTPITRSGRYHTVNTPVSDYTDAQLEDSISRMSAVVARQTAKNDRSPLAKSFKAHLVAMCKELDSRI